MAYGMDFRCKAVEYKQNGHTFEELKEAPSIPPQTFCLWRERLENGYYHARPKQVRKRKVDKERLKRAVRDKPDMFLRELAKMFGRSPQSIHAMLKTLGITRKKNSSRTWRPPRKSGRGSPPA